MKWFKVSRRIGWVATIFWLIYNTVFGWNMYALSLAEFICDEIFRVLFVAVVITFLFPLISLYEHHVRKMESQNQDEQSK